MMFAELKEEPLAYARINAIASFEKSFIFLNQEKLDMGSNLEPFVISNILKTQIDHEGVAFKLKRVYLSRKGEKFFIEETTKERDGKEEKQSYIFAKLYDTVYPQTLEENLEWAEKILAGDEFVITKDDGKEMAFNKVTEGRSIWGEGYSELHIGNYIYEQGDQFCIVDEIESEKEACIEIYLGCDLSPQCFIIQ